MKGITTPARDRKLTGGRSTILSESNEQDHARRDAIGRRNAVFALRVLVALAVAFVLMATALVVSLLLAWSPG